jgi:hypothetical protein
LSTFPANASNTIANALSRLPKLNDPHDESTFLEKIFAFNEQINAFPIAFMLFLKRNLPITKFNGALQTMTKLRNENNPTSTFGILQGENRNPYQPLLLHTHMVL